MRYLLVIGLILSALGGMTPAAAQQDTDAALELIAALNAWRIDEGLWPLALNPTLERMAVAHATYLLTLPDLPEGGDIHLGPNNETPQDRARNDYDWPVYGRADRIIIGENAHVGHSADQAITYWKGSDVHRRAALNPAYREVGVAALPHPFGHLYIAVFGGRPNVLPVQVDPAAGVMYLSNDSNTGACSGDWLCDATQIRLLDADGAPLGDWQAWAATLPLPAVDNFQVEFSDGQRQVVTAVNTATNRVLLPGQVVVAAVQETPAPTVEAPPAATPEPTSTPTAEAAPPAASGGGKTVMLIYDARTLALINESGQELDLTGVTLVSGAGKLPVTAWDTQWLSKPLQAFPAGDCLQVWSWNEPDGFAQPRDCRYVRGIITIAPEGLFWGTNAFEVQANGFTLTRCQAGSGQCSFSLP
jgi:hypothetical protein